MSTQVEPYYETLTSLINFHLGRNEDHIEIIDILHSVLLFTETMPTLKGKQYEDSRSTFDALKVKLIKQIAEL